MEGHGFAALETEWWHYDCQEWERFEVMDLPLGERPRKPDRAHYYVATPGVCLRAAYARLQTFDAGPKIS
jgi:hypothetical protein